jgi:RimJ/RimL family protein N-acetyltransferase
MAPLLADPNLYAFIGQAPPTPLELKQRYRRQTAGRSPDGSQLWLNWVVRRLDDGRAVGTVQATVTKEGVDLVAEVAWVIATDHQGRGYAREAAQLMVTWLRQQGALVVIADVHPKQEASAAVARAVGLTPTATVVDGEVRWRRDQW